MPSLRCLSCTMQTPTLIPEDMHKISALVSKTARVLALTLYMHSSILNFIVKSQILSVFLIWRTFYRMLSLCMQIKPKKKLCFLCLFDEHDKVLKKIKHQAHTRIHDALDWISSHIVMGFHTGIGLLSTLCELITLTLHNTTWSLETCLH